MIVKYFLQQTLGLLLTLGAVTVSVLGLEDKTKDLWLRALDSYHDCSTFFTFSFQIAAIVVLVREDFGISTSGMGDATVRITQAASVLVLLPLLYLMLLPRLRDDLVREAKRSTTHDQPSQRFCLFVLCWVLALYPFYSKMNGAFGPSQANNKPGHITDS